MDIGSTLSLSLLVLAIAWVVGFAVWAVAREPAWLERRSAAWFAIVTYLAATFALGATGVLATFDSMPPRPMPLFFALLVGAVILGCSRIGTALATSLSLATLVFFHAYRVIVELMLWSLHGDGLVNRVMTFDGRNFDIATGIAAIALGIVASRRAVPTWLVWLFNVAGLALLVHIVVVALLTMPTTFQVFDQGPPNELIAHAPYIWLPTVLVAAALFGHVLLTRRLLMTSTA